MIYYPLKFFSKKAAVEGTTQPLPCYTIEDNAVSPKDPRKIFLGWSLGTVLGDKLFSSSHSASSAYHSDLLQGGSIEV